MADDFHNFANSFQAQPRLGLERIRHMMKLLGHPERHLRVLHIAGTNGKGSVAVFLDELLRRAGYRVGLYTSPNLVRVNERIRVEGEPIADADLTALLSRMETVSAETLTDLGESPSQFEIWTAAALTYFADKECDYVVLEVGMGGAYDATNVIDGCVMSVLTHIDLDHTGYLGNTPVEIARTKCGILKDRCETHTVVSAPQLPEVEAVIREEAEKHGCTPLFVTPPAPRKRYGMNEAFYFEGYGDIRSGMAGVHQIENACIALTCAKQLGIDIFAAQCGITYARHPGRMEVLRENPLLLYDGGHNPNGVQALLTSLDRYLGDTPRTYIYACMRDKDYSSTLRLLSATPAGFLFTTVRDNPRAMTAEELTAAANEIGIHGECLPNLTEAITRAAEIGRPTIICGSLYLYADLPVEYRAR